MSKRATYNYGPAIRAADLARRAAAERRAAEWAGRSAVITGDHLDRYQAILDDLQQQGLDIYLSSEFDAISDKIANARALMTTDPASAKSLSQSIGPLVGPLPRAARQLRGAERASEHQSRSEQPSTWQSARAAGPSGSANTSDGAGSASVPATESPLEVAWRDSLSEWVDFLARDLAHGELAALRQTMGSPGGPNLPAELSAQLEVLRAKWEAEASKLRLEEAEVLALRQELVEQELTAHAEADIDRDERDIEIPIDPEVARREAVRAVMSALEDAGFVVENPRLVQVADGKDEVVVVGSRASGVSATFNLTLDGKLEYDFSGYKGASCDVDIDEVIPALQDVYGIQLSEEVVAWRNPDDLDTTARPRPGRTKNA